MSAVQAKRLEHAIIGEIGAMVKVNKDDLRAVVRAYREMSKAIDNHQREIDQLNALLDDAGRKIDELKVGLAKARNVAKAGNQRTEKTKSKAKKPTKKSRLKK